VREGERRKERKGREKVGIEANEAKESKTKIWRKSTYEEHTKLTKKAEG